MSICTWTGDHDTGAGWVTAHVQQHVSWPGLVSPLEVVTLLITLVAHLLALVPHAPGWTRHAAALVLLLLHCDVVLDTGEGAPGALVITCQSSQYDPDYCNDDLTCAHNTVSVQSLLPVVERDQTLGNTDRDSTPLQSIPIIKHFLPLTPDQWPIRNQTPRNMKT